MRPSSDRPAIHGDDVKWGSWPALINASSAVAVVSVDFAHANSGSLAEVNTLGADCQSVPNSISVTTTQLLLPDPVEAGGEVDEGYRDTGFTIVVG